MPLRTFTIGLVLTVASCTTSAPNRKPSTVTTLSPDDQVRTAADRDHKSGNMVEVFGTYQQIADGKAPDAHHLGHVAVRLEDGTLIHLQPPWHADAVRSPDEIAKFEGREVVAKGILFAECPPPPDGRAYPKVPCLYSEIVLVDRRTYDLLHGGGLD